MKRFLVTIGGAEKQFFERGVPVVAQGGQGVTDIIGPEFVAFIP